MWSVMAAGLGAAEGKYTTQVPPHPPPYNVETDPSERFDVAAQHPEVVARLRELIESHNASMVHRTPQL
jgi:hypothetical protein